jgi:Glycosyltransferase like family 2
MRTALEIVFWLAAALIVWTQLGYAVALAALARLSAARHGPAGTAPEVPHQSIRRSPDRGAAQPSPAAPGSDAGRPPSVSLVVAAHDEQASIAAKVRNALALDYPRELLEVIVACDGCADATAREARAAGADLVLELPRGGKIRAQDAAVQRARGELVAFSDANALWERAALAALAGAFAEPRVGYACGQVRFARAARRAPDTHREGPSAADRERPTTARRKEPPATNQEGLYWRYEMAVRALESRLSSITAGNGAIYATRRETYLVVDPIMGHDLSFPFNIVKRGRRAVYVPEARASEPMVPSIEGELARKRRMMSHTWPILLRGGMLSPRRYPPGYALMILSHRLLRYLTPFLHLVALAANIALVTVAAPGARPGGGGQSLYTATLALQLALLAAAGLGGVVRARPLLVARYYVLTTASIALGLWDWLRHGTDAAWEAAEGTRPARLPSPGAAEGTR